MKNETPRESEDRIKKIEKDTTILFCVSLFILIISVLSYLD